MQFNFDKYDDIYFVKSVQLVVVTDRFHCSHSFRQDVVLTHALT